MTEHRIQFIKKLLGYRPYGPKVARYGYNVKCSCGWFRFSNENKAHAREIAREEHLNALKAEAPHE